MKFKIKELFNLKKNKQKKLNDNSIITEIDDNRATNRINNQNDTIINPNHDNITIDQPKLLKNKFWTKLKNKFSHKNDDPDFASRHKKKNLALFSNKKRILKMLAENEITNFFFYTDSNNISLILEKGICPVRQWKLLPDQEYIVWTYLEHDDYLELELGNSTRYFFWKWCTKQAVDINKIAIIAINPDKLALSTNKDWNFDPVTNRVKINEIITLKAIDWILLKDKNIFNLAKLNIEKRKLPIKVYYGTNGEVV